jgi:acetylglutamate kinase
VSRVVLKLGGRVAGEAAAEAVALRDAGHDVVVVHGAGPQISSELERLGIPVRFVQGRRVTSAAVLEVVRASLLGVNAEVCAALGPDAVGLVGDEIGLQAQRVPELGLVGDPLPVAPEAVRRALVAGFLPVVAPLAAHPLHGTLNVNADEAAAALAVGLGAERVVFVTDVPGVLVDGVVLTELPVADADRMLDEGSFEGGIVPKLNAAVRAARRGVSVEIGQTRVLVQ